MSGWVGGAGGRRGRVPYPEEEPPGVNHGILTGTLVGEPREGRGPSGAPVTLLRIEFPVADPLHPQHLWAWASFGVEVCGAPARQKASELQGGAPILLAGQLNERWVLEDGRSCRRGYLVASLLHAGPPPYPGELFVPGARP